MKGRSTVEIGLVVPWLTHTLTQAPGQRSVEEIVEDIRSKASRSLASSVPPGFPKNHTFTMGVLVDGAPPQLILIELLERIVRNTNKAISIRSSEKLENPNDFVKFSIALAT